MLIGVINFLAFVCVSLAIGGDAGSGMIEQGRYFLSNHGKLTEVPQAVWVYSLIHLMSNFITFPLCLIGVMLDARHRQFDQENKPGR